MENVERRLHHPALKPLAAPYCCCPIDVLFAWSFLGHGYILTAQQLAACLPRGPRCGLTARTEQTHSAPTVHVFEAPLAFSFRLPPHPHPLSNNRRSVAAEANKPEQPDERPLRVCQGPDNSRSSLPLQ